ncbi:MAG: prepilin peptidase [Minisyncoccota bacterium]
MDFLMLAVVFIFGAIIGSFLNVVACRYHSGTSSLTGRSRCFACGKTLAWYELVPIVSFLVQRARCRGCRVRLSWQYPLVELISGGMFVAVILLNKPMLESVYLLVVFSFLLIIAIYDLRHRIIPDSMAASFAGLALLWFMFTAGGQAFHTPYLWTLIAGPMLFAPFWVLWAVSSGKWIGLGDGKLALGIGWFLGATLGTSAVMLAFWIGAVWALAAMALQRLSSNIRGSRLSLQSEIPFGPFLILGVVIVYFTRVNFFESPPFLFAFL